MQLIRYEDAESFLGDSQLELEKREAAHNLILGLALRLRESPTASNNPPFFATVQSDDGVLVTVLMTPPNPLVLSTMGSDDTKTLEFVIEYLLTSDLIVSGVIAPNAVAESFARMWNQTSGKPVRIGMRQRLYKLTKLRQVPIPDGGFRRARDTDLDTVSRWMAAFATEVLQEDALDKARKTAKRRIDRGEIYFWEDNEPRSMAASTRATQRGIAIGAVYTPPKWRRQGFATACVARLSEHLLKDGQSFCVLFTDLANPTSNSIYARIGYKPVCDFTLYHFGSDSV